tara:strand:+ start:158 stop:364 length:207 start_codon:yes stop_codon:yes gene_type:complete
VLLKNAFIVFIPLSDAFLDCISKVLNLVVEYLFIVEESKAVKLVTINKAKSNICGKAKPSSVLLKKNL